MAIKTKREALLAIQSRKRQRASARRVLHNLYIVAKERGWIDVLVQIQRARTRDINAAMTPQP